MNPMSDNTQRMGGAQRVGAGRQIMPNDGLDSIVANIITGASNPLTLPQIESKVLERGIKADTFDVQRAVQRLVEGGRAKLTPRFQVVAA